MVLEKQSICDPIRKAAQSLKRSSSSAQLVLDSQPFGTDNMETQVGMQVEFELLAKQFSEMGPTVEVPEAPIATSSFHIIFSVCFTLKLH